MGDRGKRKRHKFVGDISFVKDDDKSNKANKAFCFSKQRRAIYQEKAQRLHRSCQSENGNAYAIRAASELNEDLRGMINDPECSDLCFRCQDGVCVRACSMLLVARSPFFRSMMLPTRKSEVLLPDISSSILLAVLDFLHTGEIRADHLYSGKNCSDRLEAPALNWKKMFEIILAARKFKVNFLQDLICQKLWTDIPREDPYTEDMLNVLACRLSAACDSPNLLSPADALLNNIDVICLQLVELLSCYQLAEVNLRNLSEKAFNYLLHYSETKNEIHDDDNSRFSFGEYIKLRQVVMWCTSRCPKVAKDLDLYVPNPETAICFLKSGAKLEEHQQQEQRKSSSLWWSSVLESTPSSSSVENFLSMVKLNHLHPELLISIAEPLDIFPLSEIVEALRNYALKRSSIDIDGSQPKPRRKRVYRWEFSESSFYDVSGDGSTLVKSRSKSKTGSYGIAKSTLALPSYGVYEWDVIPERDLPEAWEVGLLNVHASNPLILPAGSLANSRISWALTMNGGNCGVLYHNNSPESMWTLPRGKVFGHKGKAVRVHLDRFERTCSFSYDGESSGVVFKELPAGLLFPAVCMFPQVPSTQSIRIELVSGMEYL